MSARATLLRHALGIATALALPACFIGIDESLMNAAAHDGGALPGVDGGGTPDGTSSDGDGGNGDGPVGADGPGGGDGPDPDTGVVDPRLVGYWSFDDGSHPGKDSSPAAHDGTFKTAAQLGVGFRGQALLLDGSNTMTVAALAGNAFPTAGTLSFWFYFKQHSPPVGGSTWGLFDVEDSARSHFSVEPFIEGEPQIFVEFDTTTDGPLLNGCQYNATSEQWNHVIVAWTTTGATIYHGVQGNNQLTIAVNSGPFIGGATWEAGDQKFVFGTAFAGSIDEVRLYDVTFTKGGPNDVATIP